MFSLCGILITVAFAYFFYRSAVSVIFLLPISFEVVFYLDNAVYEKNKKMLKGQFREMILSMATNLRVGYSPENAFLEAYADLVNLYGTKNKMIYELEPIKKGLLMNISFEKLLKNFEKKFNVEEITEFVDIFCLAEKTGGNLVEIIDSTAEIISQKIAVDEDIEVIIRAGKLERQIMMAIPFFIIVYIEFTNKDFFSSLYHNFTGILIMSVCLVIYLFAVKISGKIVNVRI